MVISMNVTYTNDRNNIIDNGINKNSYNNN